MFELSRLTFTVVHPQKTTFVLFLNKRGTNSVVHNIEVNDLQKLDLFEEKVTEVIF